MVLGASAPAQRSSSSLTMLCQGGGELKSQLPTQCSLGDTENLGRNGAEPGPLPVSSFGLGAGVSWAVEALRHMLSTFPWPWALSGSQLGHPWGLLLIPL